jgi:hypothetical protein
VPIGASAWVTLAGVLLALAGFVVGAHLLLPAP